ncbi:MAG: tripartite tricarboxylate transporter TctB family protein [Gammaproteobacteria bacterium]|nr:tripartite tricarboxylate transporter TctB family protein [Gammaproteobacteria bacterium]
MTAHDSPSGGDRRRARRVADLVHGIDLVIAAVLLAFCAWIYYLTTQFEEVAALFAQDVPPEFLPRLLVWTIAILSVLLPFEHLIKPAGRAHFDKARSQPIAGMAYLTAGLLILIVASVELIGTYFAIIAVCVAMPLLWGERRWLLIIPFAVLFPTVVMVVFAKVLGVYFEPGLFGINLR